ncbi:hypothetical protein F4821DRAFT_127738 [Hypoxylon rubiginosum]|uniref:Uncharacterized protein n=1 Tax=Hypoxylon rubiginosum TaxID=110542 RepID=A0ACC0D1N4_9PEZI|nr:hypothetical protein F4821DRAFT_127738 [Hypoxylon rubiginosum]
MKPTRYATSRQKVCHHCSAAKAKCDRKSGRCTRCTRRGLSCTYPQILPTEGSSAVSPSADVSELGKTSTFSTSEALSAPESLLLTPQRVPRASTGPQFLTSESIRYIPGQESPTDSSSTLAEGGVLQDSVLDPQRHSSPTPETLDFSVLELFNPINVDQISNRWLNSYIPVPGQKVKDYPATVSAFIYRVLKSYVVVAIRGRGVPPFIHSSQITASSIRPPLSTCLSLIRVCERPLPGSQAAASDVLQREMGNLYEQHKVYDDSTHDDVTLLAAFQAYLIYSMALFFRLDEVSSPFLRQAMMNLQELACSSSRGGLMCTAEQQRSRPRWESWIVAEAKRRTLFTMYLFDSVLSTHDGLQTFLGTELRGLPASSNGSLWRAQTRREWQAAYNVDLADWPEGCFRIDELWPFPPELNELQVLEQRNRVDQWLENVDEFGTMLYAVTSCTHGG